jgi:acyl-coenzyme A synthetase/AMP-(fatty) acid ligase
MRTDVVPGEVTYRTGDVMYRDQAGRYVYVDRADRVVKRNGVRISLLEVSDACAGLGGVTGAACVAFDNDGTLGIAAFVVAPGGLTTVDIRDGVGRLLPDTMLPDHLHVVAELPLTSSGKLDEARLLAGAGLAPIRRSP